MVERQIPNVTARDAVIPIIGFGTGGSMVENCAAAVTQALRAGFRHIDTARKYGTEEGVGEGMRAAGVARSEIFLVTKVSHEDHAPDRFARSVDDSLKALGVDHVDLLHVHWPLPDMDLKATMGALAQAKRAGLAKHIGVANFNIALIRQALEFCPEPLTMVQGEYHPYLDQQKLLVFCRSQGLAFTAYCPLARGKLLDDPVLTALASDKNKTVAQIVLRWFVQQEVIPIPKTVTPQRMKENIDVFDFSLTEAEMKRIHALARPDGRLVDPKGRAPTWD